MTTDGECVAEAVSQEAAVAIIKMYSISEWSVGAHDDLSRSPKAKAKRENRKHNRVPPETRAPDDLLGIHSCSA